MLYLYTIYYITLIVLLHIIIYNICYIYYIVHNLLYRCY